MAFLRWLPPGEPWESSTSHQWLFLVPSIGGRYHIIPQLAVYATYIPFIYCQLGDYMIPEFPNINPRIRKTLGNPCRNEWGTCKLYLIGGFCPTHLKNMRTSKWDHLPQVGMENNKYLKPPRSISYVQVHPLKMIAWEAEDYSSNLKTVNHTKKVIRDTTMKSNGWNLEIIQLTKENYLPNLHFWVQNVKCPGCIYNC